MNSLQIKFLIFIAVVAVITLGFAVLIFRQLGVVAKKALEAKKQQEEQQQQGVSLPEPQMVDQRDSSSAPADEENPS